MVLGELEAWRVNETWPIVLELRKPTKEKTAAQRSLWHAVIGDIAEKVGLTPREVKDSVKKDYWGAKPPSTEKLDRDEYGKLIDYTYQWAAEREVYIPDRRTK